MGLEVVIFGGGGAGLWLLDALVRDGYDVLLLESDALGSGQTIASQGIIHGGLKYTLTGMFTSSARAIREMPLIWRRSLAGEHPPDLSKTKLRSEFCYLWQTGSLSSRVAMIGARAGLRVRPRSLSREQRPPILADCPGTVARLDEQVIEPISLLSDLADQHRDRILKIDAVNGLEFDSAKSGVSGGVIRLINPDTGEPLELKPRDVILTAGEGNAQLRRSMGLSSSEMQTRPLHMVMVRGGRGSLPLLNGHCVDGRSTRLTITSTTDYAERTVWQIGGQIAERGVSMEPAELISFAASELRDVIPGFNVPGAGVNLDELEWNTYRVNRAEQASAGGHRPADVHVKREGRTITAWPTKLALVPRMASLIQDLLEAPSGGGSIDRATLVGWPRPGIALPPWERQDTWFNAD
ncbi:MAG: FAD-dependent oxidoreductase [Planctomycetes bacterium]|nr:FAD-dependent oxidoreductase [Planctomycetota bacterium]